MEKITKAQFEKLQSILQSRRSLIRGGDPNSAFGGRAWLTTKTKSCITGEAWTFHKTGTFGFSVVAQAQADDLSDNTPVLSCGARLGRSRLCDNGVRAFNFSFPQLKRAVKSAIDDSNVFISFCGAPVLATIVLRLARMAKEIKATEGTAYLIGARGSRLIVIVCGGVLFFIPCYGVEYLTDNTVIAPAEYAGGRETLPDYFPLD